MPASRVTQAALLLAALVAGANANEIAWGTSEDLFPNFNYPDNFFCENGQTLDIVLYEGAEPGTPISITSTATSSTSFSKPTFAYVTDGDYYNGARFLQIACGSDGASSLDDIWAVDMLLSESTKLTAAYKFETYYALRIINRQTQEYWETPTKETRAENSPATPAPYAKIKAECDATKEMDGQSYSVCAWNPARLSIPAEVIVATDSCDGVAQESNCDSNICAWDAGTCTALPCSDCNICAPDCTVPQVPTGTVEHCACACPPATPLFNAVSNTCDACPSGEEWDSVTSACAATSPVDCVGTWGACDASCKSTYSVTTSAANGGAACPASDQAQGDCDPNDSLYDECCPGGEVWDVNAQSCLPPLVDCVFEYDACDSTCTKGVIVTTPAEHGGQACPVGREDCSPADSPDDACCEENEFWDSYAGCVEQIWGCMDHGALNFNHLANVADNGQCQYPITGCNDENARNWEPQVTAGHEDNSLCIYDCVGDYGTCAADCQKPFNVIQSPANGGTPCPESSALCHPDDDVEDACCPGGEEYDNDVHSCQPVYSANDISDISAFVSGVDSLGFSGDPADHCQGGAMSVSFRYQPPTDPAEPPDTRSFTAATLRAHLDTLEAGSVNLKVVCDFGPGQSASDDFTVTITCGAADVDGDGVCDHNDACASVQCQAFGSEDSIFTCVDTDVDTNAGNYQCREDPDDANDVCGGRGFTGPNCEVCAEGSGWNGDDANPQCVECVAPEHTASLSAGEQCSDVNCDPGQGVLTDFNPAASNNCKPCDPGFYSAGGDAACVQCDDGYTSGVGASGCSNVDECYSLETYPCDTNAQCTDTEGSFTCACNTGWSGDGFSCLNENECVAGTYPCDTNAQCDDTVGSHECTCKAGYSGSGEICTADACVASSVLGKDGSDGEIYCVHDGTVTGTTGGCGCVNVRGFSGDGNEKCERADGTPTEKITINGKLFCVDKDPTGKPTVDARDRVRAQHGGNTPAARAPAARKARKEAMRDMMKDARAVIPVADINADTKQKKDAQGDFQPAFIWLQDYTVDLDEDNDYADGSATKAKFEKLPTGSTLKMVVGFDVGVDSTVVVSARPRKTKGEARDVDRVVLATPTSTAVLGIMNADDSDAIATAKFTGKGVNAGYDWQCSNDAGAWVNPDGGATKQDGEDVVCPIARGEPVARTFDVGSGEETTTACMQANALNYLDTAAHHDQTLCCVVEGCDSEQLSDAFAAASSGCGDNAGGHTENVDGNCQTTQCEQAQLFDAYESRTAQCSV